MSKLIHDDARYADGRKVCLGDVFDPHHGDPRRVGIACFGHGCREASIFTTEGQHWRTRHHDSKVSPPSLIRRATRREFFEMVGMDSVRIQRLHFWNSPGIADDFQPWVKEREEQLFNAWLDEPMFNEEGEMQ